VNGLYYAGIIVAKGGKTLKRLKMGGRGREVRGRGGSFQEIY